MVKIIDSQKYFNEIVNIAKIIDLKIIDKLLINIKKIQKKKGRIFFLGVGGSAGNCSHAVNDFRKLCGIECYTPTDNISELTARVNDEGWETVFIEWLKISNLSSKDAIFILSVGGGDIKKNVSVNLINAIKFAKTKKSKIFGIVGRDGGYTKKNADCVVVIPNTNNSLVTPLSEAYQSVVWHYLVSDSRLQIKKTKW